jgi:hypothetical protein
VGELEAAAFVVGAPLVLAAAASETSPTAATAAEGGWEALHAVRISAALRQALSQPTSTRAAAGDATEADALLALAAHVCMAVCSLCVLPGNKDRFVAAAYASNVVAGSADGAPAQEPQPRAAQRKPLVDALVDGLTAFHLTAESSVLFLSDRDDDDDEVAADNEGGADATKKEKQQAARGGDREPVLRTLEHLAFLSAAALSVLKEVQISRMNKR